MNKKIISLLIFIVIFISIVFAVYYYITPKSYLKIEVAPEQVSLKIDNENSINITNGNTITIKPGDHKLIFSRDEFDSYTINISIKKDESKSVIAVLKALTENAKKLLNNSKSNKVIEKFTGINLYNQDSKALINYPILKILPINNPYYRVMACNSKQFPNDSEKIAICVIMDDLGYKNDLKNEIIHRGYNLDNYEVIWN